MKRIFCSFARCVSQMAIRSLLLLASAACLCLFGCAKRAQAAPPPPVVQVMDITPTNAPASVEFIGQLDSPQNVEVRAKVETLVDKVFFIESTEVKEGDPGPNSFPT
jgi:membrane fusion protein (multidrug efflux system)